MQDLGIELICAYSPQAKGRVERANQTLQDRLVKELRLNGIDNYSEANHFLESYIPLYNQKFAVQPILPADGHEPLQPENDLDLIFSKRFTRILSNNLSFQFARTVYQIQTHRPAYALQGRQVEICQSEDGKIIVLLNGERLAFKPYFRQPKRSEVSTGKDLEWKPSADHPWRQYGYRLNEKTVHALK